MLPVYLHTARLCQSAKRRRFPCRRRGKRNSTPTQTRRRPLCCAAIIPQSDCLHKCRTKKHRPTEPLRHSVSFSARSRNRTRIGRRRAPSDTANRRTQADRPAKPARQRRKTTSRPRTFRRRRMYKTPYTPQNLKPLASAAAARIPGGSLLSTADSSAAACVPGVLRLSVSERASLLRPLPSAAARQNRAVRRRGSPSACAPAFTRPFPFPPAHTPVCPKTAFISANAPPSSKRAPQTNAGGKTCSLSPAGRLRFARYNRASPPSRRNTVCDNKEIKKKRIGVGCVKG